VHACILIASFCSRVNTIPKCVQSAIYARMQKKKDKDYFFSELKTISCYKLLGYSSQGCPSDSG